MLNVSTDSRCVVRGDGESAMDGERKCCERGCGDTRAVITLSRKCWEDARGCNACCRVLHAAKITKPRQNKLGV